jgi:predicted nucleic acid-binding protein
MFYLDSSVTVALLTNEPDAETAQTIIDRLLGQGLAGVCSDWSVAEYRCAIAAKHRMGLITLKNVAAVANALDILRAAKFVGANTLPTDIVRAGELAVQIVSQPLRAADALHIAIASRLGITHFVSFDKTQATAARKALVGVQVIKN